MRRCWELAPEDRPTFKEVYTNISSYIEHMAGYLKMGFNPFSAGEVADSAERGVEDEVECSVTIQVTPASAPMTGAHTTLTDDTY